MLACRWANVGDAGPTSNQLCVWTLRWLAMSGSVLAQQGIPPGDSQIFKCFVTSLHCVDHVATVYHIGGNPVNTSRCPMLGWCWSIGSMARIWRGADAGACAVRLHSGLPVHFFQRGSVRIQLVGLRFSEVRQFVLLLPLHPPVLEPDLDLSLRQV